MKEFVEADEAPHALLLQGADGAFYGTMARGGSFGLGGVFKLSADGSTISTIYSFDGPHGAVPLAGLVQGPDALYGTTAKGGVWGHGTVFKVSTDGSAFSVLHAFDAAGGASPRSGLALGPDGALYGTTYAGGAHGAGTVFKVGAGGASFSVLHTFQRTDGANPNAGVILGADGALYGTTSSGGSSSASVGTVFRLLSDGSSFSVLRSLDEARGGKFPNAGLVQLADGLLYGTATSGGAYDGGTVFVISPDGSAFSVLHSFAYPEGMNPWGPLTPAADGALYGTTCCGGHGSIFRISPSGAFAEVRTFDAAINSPQAGLIQAVDGNLYGTTLLGGSFNEGSIFRMPTDGSSISVLHSFPFTDGSQAIGPLVQDPDGNLYGTTWFGGSYSYGAVFKASPDGSSFTVLHSFQGTDGGLPSGLILGVDGALYGTTYTGISGTGDAGTVFRILLDGSDFSVLHKFTVADSSAGLGPNSALVQGSDGALYGTTTSPGTVFRILPDGSSFTVVHRLETDGGEFAPLIQGADGALYGTSVYGGSHDLGTVFRISTDGASYSVLHSFQGSDGAFPTAGLVQGTDGRLYGTAPGDGYGFQSLGTIFAVSPDGSGFTVLHDFDGTNGSAPRGALVQGPHGALYGTAFEGGPTGAGTVFKIMPDGSGFSTLHAFRGEDGINPFGLTLGRGGVLYGSALIGGHYGGGVLFRLEDDDGIQFSAPVFTSRGPSTKAVVTVTRRRSTSTSVMVDYATTNGSAADGVEYVATSGQLIFPPGVLTKTFAVKVLPTETYRGDRTFAVALSNPQGSGARLGFQKTAVVSLTDTTPVPRIQFSAAAYTAAEGVSAVKISVLRSGPVKAPVTVDFTTSDGTASAPGDYEPASGTLTFGAGVTSQAFNVHLRDNATPGPGRFLNLTLSIPGGGAILGSRAVARLNIVDNDQALQFGAPDYLTSGAASKAVVSVRRTGGRAGTITVQYATGYGTALPGVDYQPVAGTLAFGPGVASRSFSVPILNGSPSGGTRTVPLLLTGANPPGALGPVSAATLRIQDAQEPLVQFGSTSFVAHVTGGKRTAVVTVKRLGSMEGTASVDYATSDGTAVSAQDYLPASGQLTFGPGIASLPVKVTVLSDPAARPDPTVNLTLGQVDVPVGTPAAAILTIANGRRSGQVQLAGAAFSGSTSAGVVSIPVSRTGGAAGSAAVEYGTSDGSAVAGVDYAAANGTLRFAPGETKKWIFVSISPTASGGNQFFVSLGATDGGLGIGPSTQAPVWILP